MQIIEVKGHSGCAIDVEREANTLYVHKSTKDPGYFKRLALQGEKQLQAAAVELQHIRVPKIHEITRTENEVRLKMDYIYSRNFVEFFEQAGFEQINYLIEALIKFLEYEIANSGLTKVSAEIVKDKFADVKKKTLGHQHLKGDKEIESIIDRSEKILNRLGALEMPVGICHGDLTFSNILFNGNNYYLIDFLDSFIESPLLDIVKLRQDTAWLWSQQMYTKACDTIRLRIAFNKIDSRLHSHFQKNYAWYRDFYRPLQLMNFLRILQYAHEPKVIDYLKRTINEQLKEF